MTDKNRPGMGFEVNIRSADRKSATGAASDSAFNMLILGNFSGRHELSSVGKPFAKRRPVLLDRDNFEDVMAQMVADQDIAGSTLQINELDDFHPDNLFAKLDVFARLRGIRRRLKDKSRFDEAAAEIMGWLVPEGEAKTEAPAAPASSANLLDDILQSTSQPSSEIEMLSQPGGVDAFVKQIIAPYVEPATNPRQPEMIDAVDKAVAEQMRRVLHDTRFQQLEAAWRALYFLVTRIETGSRLKIHVLDVSKRELEQDLSGEVETSVMYKRFCDPAANDIQWSVMIGDYLFTDVITDALLLAQLGVIAQAANAPFIAGATSTLGGCESFSLGADVDDWQYEIKSGFASAWGMLRESPVAHYLALALPRFLLRAPYGKKSRPIEAFSFEEIEGDPASQHEHLLWGNAAFVKAEQLARAFAQQGWNMNPADTGQTEGLPMFYYDHDGDTALMPCAELYLTESGGRRLRQQGLMTLWSVKNTDAVRSGDFNALVDESVTLQGRWNG